MNAHIEPVPLKIIDGLPDLTVTVVPEKSSIAGGPPPQGVPQESSVVTITVQNRVSFFGGPIIAGNIRPAFGRDVQGVMVSIVLSSGLQQVGGMSVPAGFLSAVAPNHQTIFFYGGTIQTAASVVFEFDVVADCLHDDYASILAEVDPYSFITEASKTNNMANAKIGIICMS